MKPLGNRALIYVDESLEPAIVGGIHLPLNAAKRQYPEAKVIAVGPQCTDVKPGDTVIVDRYALASLRVQYQDKQHFLIAEPDIIGIIT